VDHGIEKPDERTRRGKPSRATITIGVARVNGSKVEISVTDDGAGVDVERVKGAAIRRGLIAQADAGALSEGEATALVFHSEVSTSPMVTAVSGRGLGMAIVRSKAEKLGGAVSIESRRHAGTTLRVVLPMTMATFRGILVVACEQTFVVPTAHV